jgi:Tol biopolymer transport system component
MRFGTHPFTKALAIFSSAALLGLTVQCEFASSQTTSANTTSPNTSILTFGSPAMVSTSPSGAAGNGSSFHANFSPDGKHLLFWSNSTNFVSGLTNGNQQLYIKDLTTGAIALVSADANGMEGNNLSLNVNNSAQVLMFSPDGTKVVFESSASNLVPAGTNGSQQIFLKDLTTGEVTLVSADANGVQGNDDSSAFSFSPDGTKIVFDSSASNLLPGGTHTQDVFVKDLTTGAVTLVSSDAGGVEGNNASSWPVFSPDGTEIAFASLSTNFVPGTLSREIYVKNLLTGAITLVSADLDGVAGNGENLYPMFSPDGSKVAFNSLATNLVPVASTGNTEIYVKNLATGAITLVSADANGVEANNFSLLSVFTPDGTKIAFESPATNLIPSGTNGSVQVFLKDLPTGAVILASTDANGTQGNGPSSDPNFSAGQTAFAFQSAASSLGSRFGTTQIYVRSVTTQFPPAVTTSPSNLTITTGQTASFTASANGMPSPTIQWQVSTDGGATFTDIPGATSTTLTFTATLSQTGNLYQAVFTNSAGSATSSAALLTVLNPATTTTLLSSANPSVFGQAVTFTATVTSPGGAPTGTVTFSDNSTTLGSGSLDASGMATLTTASLAVGPHSITASYSGDANFTSSSSSPLSQTVNKAATTVTSTSSLNPNVFGESVTFSAFVAPVAPGAGSPAGTVSFQDGAALLGASSLTNGQASFTVSTLAVGSHSITAVYNGDGNFTGASSTSLAQSVNKAASSTVVVSSANPSLFNQSVSFTATVAAVSPGAGTPTGTVNFLDGSASLGSASLTAGQATFTSSSLSVASHSITAVYVGDGNFNGSGSAALPQIVARPTAIVTVSSSLNPSLLNQQLVLTAKVTAAPPATGTPTGTVAFQDGATSLGTVALNSSGVATLTLSTLAAGSHVVIAVYSGDAGFSGASSAPFTQSVQYAQVGSACDGEPGHQILPPIDPAGASVFKQRRTIPAKFRVCDANGVSIGTPGVVSNFSLIQILTGTVLTKVLENVYTNNPDTAFRWDPTSQQWIFNIDNSNLAAGSTYFYAVTLNDGSVIYFQYGLR